MTIEPLHIRRTLFWIAHLTSLLALAITVYWLVYRDTVYRMANLDACANGFIATFLLMLVSAVSITLWAIFKPVVYTKDSNER